MVAVGGNILQRILLKKQDGYYEAHHAHRLANRTVCTLVDPVVLGTGETDHIEDETEMNNTLDTHVQLVKDKKVTSSTDILDLFNIQRTTPAGETFNEHDQSINALANAYWSVLRIIANMLDWLE